MDNIIALLISNVLGGMIAITTIIIERRITANHTRKEKISDIKKEIYIEFLKMQKYRNFLIKKKKLAD